MKKDMHKNNRRRKNRPGHSWWKRSLAVFVAAATLLMGAGFENVSAQPAAAGVQTEAQTSQGTQETEKKAEATAQAETEAASEGAGQSEPASTGEEEKGKQEATAETAKAQAAQSSQKSQTSKESQSSQGNKESHGSGEAQAGKEMEAELLESLKAPSYQEAPQTLTLDQLKSKAKAVQQAERSSEGIEAPKIDVYLYAEEEKSVILQTGAEKFEGNAINKDTAPEFSEDSIAREFAYAEMIYISGAHAGSSVRITGLYSTGYVEGNTDNSVWYYTTEDSDQGSQEYGDVQVGYKLPQWKEGASPAKEVEIRFYYRTTGTPAYHITGDSSLGTISDLSDFNVTIANKKVENESLNQEVPQNQRVVLEFRLPVKYESAKVILLNGTSAWKTYNTTSVKPTVSTSELEETSEREYRAVFQMPGNDLTLKIEPTEYSTNDTRYYGAYIDLHMEDYYFGNVGHDMNGIMGRAGVYTSKVGNTTQTPKYNENASDYDGKLNISSFGIGVYEGGANPAWIRERKFKQVTSGVSTYDKRNSKQSANNQQHQEVYTSPTGTSKVTMPVGTRTPDQDVEMTFEVVAGKYAGNANKQAAYTPSVLHVDVYQGKNNYNTQNFVRQDFTLPTSGKGIHNLDMGGTVTIEAVTYSSKGNYKINMSGVTGKEGLREWENNWMYGYPREMRNELESAPSDNVFNLQWYKYKVTVSGCSYAWKLGMETEYSGSSNYITAALEGIEAGSLADGTSGSNVSSPDQVTGSYISRGSTPTYYPLVEGFQVSKYNTLSDGTFIYALKPKDGYSKPETSTVQGNSKGELTPIHGDTLQAVGSGEVQKPDSQGRFLFKLRPKDGSDNTNPPTYLHFTSKPIKLHTSYYYNDKKYSQTDQEMTLSLSNGDAQNQVIELLLPTELETATDQFLQGYKVYVVPASGGDKQWELKPDDNGTYWNSGDVINFNHVYSQMVENGWLDDTSTTYQLRITAVADSSNADGLVKTGYGVYIQKGYFSHTTTGSTYGNADKFMEIGGGENRLWAFNGEEMTLTGYKNPLDRTAKNQGFFKVGLKSQLTATVKPNQKVANIYYLSAVKASIDITEIQGDSQITEDFKKQVEAWNSAQAGTLFTSVNEENHVVHYEDIDTALPKTLSDGRKFLGWRVKDPSGGTYSEDIPQTGKINLFTLGGNQNSGSYGDYSGDVFAQMYKDLFGGMSDDGITYQGGSGELVLVPYYVGQKIESASDETIQKNYYQEEGPYTLEADFKLEGEAPVDETSAAATVQYAVFARDPSSDNYGLTEKGTINLVTGNASRTKEDSTGTVLRYPRFAEADLEVNVASAGTGQDVYQEIKLTFSNIPRIGGSGMDYRIYLWNKMNGEKLASSLSVNYNTAEALDAALDPAVYPANKIRVYRIPKVGDDGSGTKAGSINSPGKDVTVSNSTKTQLIYSGKDITISGTFRVCNHDQGLATAEAFLNTADLAGTLKVALYKQDPGTSVYKVFAIAENKGDSSNNLNVTYKRNNISGGTIAVDTAANDLTVTFTKSDVTRQYDANAKYRLYMWTETNGDPGVEKFGKGEDDLTIPAADINAITNLPSVETTMEMSRITYGEDGTMHPTSEDSIKLYQQADDTYSKEAVFYVKGDPDQLTTPVYYAVYTQDITNNGWGLTEKGSVSLQDLANPTRKNAAADVADVRLDQAALTVNTATVSGTGDGTVTKITLSFTGIPMNKIGDSGIRYRCYMWNAGNGEMNLNNVPSGKNARLTEDQLNSSFSQNAYPTNRMQLFRIPKVYDYSTDGAGTNISNRGQTKSFFVNQDFTVISQFTLQNGNGEATATQLINNTALAGELKLVLYKQTPSATSANPDYKLFAVAETNGQGGLDISFQWNTLTNLSIQADGNSNSFTVTFTKTETRGSYDDGAKYRLYAYTGNNKPENLPDLFGKPNGSTSTNNNKSAISADALQNLTGYPSVETTTKPIELGSMINYPKEIVMLENVKTDGRIYSADQKVTIAEALGVDPDQGSSVDVVIKEIREGKELFIERSAGNNPEIINLECYLGSVNDSAPAKIGAGGKVGTLSLNPQTGSGAASELLLHFRSKDTVDAADGTPFTGTMVFEFTKVAGTP